MAPMRLMRALAPAMAEAGGGRIVNVCSSSGKRPSLTNRRLLGHQGRAALAEPHVRRRVGGRGVLVNAVAPGPVESELWMGEGGLADQVAERTGSTRDEVLASTHAKPPLGRMGPRTRSRP